MLPGVEVDCGRDVMVPGREWNRAGMTRIKISINTADVPFDQGNLSHTEVDGLCIYTDGIDTLRVGYVAVLDPASRVTASTNARGVVRVANRGSSAGFVDLFTKSGGQGDLLNGTYNSIAATGYRSTSPDDFFGFDVMEFAVATEKPWDSLMNHEFDLFIDADMDGVPEAVVLAADLGLLTGAGFTGQIVTAQIDLVNGGSFLDWNVIGTDFNDSTVYMPFTMTGPSGGLVPPKFAYTLQVFGRDGSFDVQTGVIDMTQEIMPELSSFGLLPGGLARFGAQGQGDLLVLYPNNINRRQFGTVKIR
jgi:hypothetical protein